MYDGDRPAVEALWRAIATSLRSQGLDDVPDAVEWPVDLAAHWRDPALLLSQTCSYPLTHQLLHRVQVVGAFRYSAEGCEGISYRSMLVARAADAGRHWGDFKGRRLAANSLDSQSGFNCLRAAIPDVDAASDPFFAQVVISGSHRQSIEAVRGGHADIAAIDCVTLASLKRVDRYLMEGLCVVGDTAPTPGLPLITSLDASPRQILLLRRVLKSLFEDAALAPVREALLLDAFEPVGWSAYEGLRQAA
ncbi:PhnD/SsuA/transferrin family substrate-binding protein [soil metagenome]